jgi:hypothetical protein
MEQAFLGQDCLFVTFAQDEDDSEDDEDDEEIDLADLPLSAIVLTLGQCIRWKECDRFSMTKKRSLFIWLSKPYTDFSGRPIEQLAGDSFPAITKRYRIPVPSEA